LFPARRHFFGIDLSNSRFETLLSWVAASVVTATAVIYALKPPPNRAKAGPDFANSSPAQEPLAVQEARAA
jgi:hypothetical protein